MAIIIAIEGNIGSGKSTMVDFLKSQYNNKILFGRKVVFLQEPVKQWEEINSDGVNILEKFYANQKMGFLISDDGLHISFRYSQKSSERESKWYYIY